MQVLVQEGLLFTLPRRGTFVGRAPHQSHDVYLLAVGYAPEAHAHLLRIGFEERIAPLGCATLVLPLAEAVECRRQGTLPAIAGIFDHSEGPPNGVTWGIDRTLPRVCFHAWNEDALHADVLAFDDQGGGWLASACAAAAQLLNVPEVTAVLAANDCAALGMCAALSDAHIPRAQWPPLIGFDGRPAPSSFVLTSLRLPWEEIGRTAADFLWERRTQVYRGRPRQRQVPMRLIHRVGTQGLAPV